MSYFLVNTDISIPLGSVHKNLLGEVGGLMSNSTLLKKNSRTHTCIKQFEGLLLSNLKFCDTPTPPIGLLLIEYLSNHFSHFSI